MAIALVLLAALALPALAQPIDVGRNVNDLWNIGAFPSWKEIWIVMVVFSVAVISITYMVSQATGNDPLKAWARNELVQVFFSVLAVMAALGGIAVGTQALTQLAQIDPQASTICPLYQTVWPCHVALGINYLDIMFMTGVDNAKHLITFNSYLMPVATMSFNFGQMAGLRAMKMTTPFSGLTMLGENIATVFDLLVKTLMAIRFQQFILDFTVQYLFPVTLVMGLMLRTLFFTRKLGGLLIAIALSLYFVFPTMYAINGWVLYLWSGGFDLRSENALFTVNFNDTGVSHPGFENPVSGSVDGGSQIEGLGGVQLYFNASYARGNRGQNITLGPMPAQLDLCNDTPRAGDMNIAHRFAYKLQDKMISSPTSAVKIAWYLANLGTYNVAWGFDFFLGPDGYLGNLAKLFLFSLVVPFIGVMTTLASIKALSPMLGGDTEIAGLTHLI